MSVMNPPDYTELLQEIKRLKARIAEPESKNKALSDENEDLKKLLHEQGAYKVDFVCVAAISIAKAVN
jgi:regulator of replication initiation timing